MNPCKQNDELCCKNNDTSINDTPLHICMLYM